MLNISSTTHQLYIPEWTSCIHCLLLYVIHDPCLPLSSITRNNVTEHELHRCCNRRGHYTISDLLLLPEVWWEILVQGAGAYHQGRKCGRLKLKLIVYVVQMVLPCLQQCLGLRSHIYARFFPGLSVCNTISQGLYRCCIGPYTCKSLF